MIDGQPKRSSHAHTKDSATIDADISETEVAPDVLVDAGQDVSLTPERW